MAPESSLCSRPSHDMPTPRRGPLGATDLSRWRLDSQDNGRHVWHFAGEDAEAGAAHAEVCGVDERRVKQRQQQTDEERYWLGLPLDDLTSTEPRPRPATPLQAARKGFELYKRLQSEDGHWAGEYGG